jgi:hypothetical protein
MLLGVRWSFGLLGLALGCTLRGDGERGSVTRELPVFAAIELFDGFDATVTVDPSLPADAKVALEVSGDDNALHRLFTVVHSGSTLSVAVDPNHLTELDLTPAIEARVPALTRAHAEDTTGLEIFGAMGELRVAARESATVTLHGAAPLTLHAEASGQASLIVAGEGPLLELVVDGAATVDARDFTASRVTVHARGDGPITVCATAEIKIVGAGAEQVELECE